MSKEAGQVRLASLIYLEERGALHKAILFSCKKTKARVQKIIKAWAQDRKILACAKDLGVRRKGAKSESPRLLESRGRAAEGRKYREVGRKIGKPRLRESRRRAAKGRFTVTNGIYFVVRPYFLYVRNKMPVVCAARFYECHGGIAIGRGGWYNSTRKEAVARCARGRAACNDQEVKYETIQNAVGIGARLPVGREPVRADRVRAERRRARRSRRRGAQLCGHRRHQLGCERHHCAEDV